MLLDVQPSRQGIIALRGRRIQPGVGPPITQRAMEPLDLPVRLRTVRVVLLVPDPQLNPGGTPRPRPVAGTVIR